MFARHDDGAARSANRVGTKTVLKQHPLPRQAIDIGSWVDRFEPPVVGTDGMGRVVVAENKEDIVYPVQFTNYKQVLADTKSNISRNKEKWC